VDEFVMTELDYGTFDRAFRRVLGAYALMTAKVKPATVDDLSRTYFKVLDGAPLADVLTAGKTCLLTCPKFPTIAQWSAALPVPTIARVSADLRVMSTHERETYTRAEALRWSDAPCGCWPCENAGMADYALRFVPDDVNGVLDRAIDTVRNRIVVTGYWAHGDELARWYRARDTFFASAPRHTPIARALLVLVPREPGEEG
jgi:hypothetical protein